MRKFIIQFIIFLLPLLCIPIANYVIDPSHIYDDYGQQVVSTLQGHRYVINVDPDKDERLLMKAMIDSCKKDIDVLILGSSRVMQISEDMFDNKRVLNLGVSGATYEDITGLLYLYLQGHKTPKAIIIGIDPQHFNANIGDTRWKSIDREYARYSEDVLGEKVSCGINLEKWENLFSVTYFQEAIKYYKRPKRYLQAIDYDIQGTDIEYGIAIRYDGSSVYGREYETRSLTKTNHEAQTEIYSQWENYKELSTRELNRWQNLIQYARQQCVELYFFEAAFHPIVYHRLTMDAQFEGMKKGMEYVEKMAEENGITQIGSYNPDDCHLCDSDFYDGMHMRRRAIERELKRGVR